MSIIIFDILKNGFDSKSMGTSTSQKTVDFHKQFEIFSAFFNKKQIIKPLLCK